MLQLPLQHRAHYDRAELSTGIYVIKDAGISRLAVDGFLLCEQSPVDVFFPLEIVGLGMGASECNSKTSMKQKPL